MRISEAPTSPAVKRYAQAAYRAAQQSGTLPALHQQVTALDESLQSHASLAHALSNPGLTPARRQAFVNTLVSQLHLTPDLAGLLQLLAKNQRLANLPAVLETLLSLFDQADSVATVQVETAQPLTESQRINLKILMKTHMGAKNVHVVEKIVPTLIGGFRAFFGGKMWDASVRGRLATLTEHLRQTPHHFE